MIEAIRSNTTATPSSSFNKVTSSAYRLISAGAFPIAIPVPAAWRMSRSFSLSPIARSGDADYAVIKGFGTVYRPTTFFRCRDGEARVTCGCFYGTIDEFREQVKRTREGKVANEYLKIADLMEYHFKEDGGING